jgi:O-antigen/teichoic acid export membrane protein
MIKNKRIFGNSLSGALQLIISSGLMLIAVPLFIRLRSVEYYGIYSIVMIIGNVGIFMNLGLTSTLVKYLAEQGRQKESDYDIVITFWILAFITISLSSLFLYFRSEILLYILKIPSAMFHECEMLFILVLVSNSILVLGQVPSSILDSQHCIYLTNLLQIIYSFVLWGLIILILIMDGSLGQLGFANLFSAVLWFLASVVTALRVWGKISIEGLKNNIIRIFFKQLKYSLKVYIGSAISFFSEPLTKILIAQFIGISEVGFFDIALKIRSLVYGIVSKLLYPLLPKIAQLKDRIKIQELVNEAEKLTVLIVVPLSAIIICISHPLISLWIGKNVETISRTTSAMVVIVLLCSSTITPYYHYLIAKDRASITILIQTSNILVNAAIFLCFVNILRYNAAIISNVLAVFASFLLVYYFQKKEFNNFIFSSKKQIIHIVMIFILLLIIGELLSSAIGSDIFTLLIVPIVSILAAMTFYRHLNLITREDIFRYVGQNNAISNYAVLLLCKKRQY